jgi:hypothetical protein
VLVSVAVVVDEVRVVRVDVSVVVTGCTMTAVTARVMTVSVVDSTVADSVSWMMEVMAGAYTVTAAGSRQAQADEYSSRLGQLVASGNRGDDEVVEVVVDDVVEDSVEDDVEGETVEEVEGFG